eukprot:scaffold44882_cov49-Phaeocystis_antarctica.AAC.3
MVASSVSTCEGSPAPAGATISISSLAALIASTSRRPGSSLSSALTRPIFCRGVSAVGGAAAVGTAARATPIGGGTACWGRATVTWRACLVRGGFGGGAARLAAFWRLATELAFETRSWLGSSLTAARELARATARAASSAVANEPRCTSLPARYTAASNGFFRLWSWGKASRRRSRLTPR